VELYDKKLASVLLKQYDQKSIFSYQYDRYGIDDITTYLREYAYRYSTWGIQDYGREAYPDCAHKTFAPTFKNYKIDGHTVIFYYEGKESVERYGDAERVQIEVTLPPVGDELFVSLKLTNKKETPYVESGSFIIPFGGNVTKHKINKSNTVLDIAADIQEDANHVFYCLENYITAMNEKNGLCVITKDSPLVSLGDTGVYQYRKNYEKPKEPIAYFNLFNNMWGTNFPQWIGGDFCYRFVLFGFDKSEEVSIMERAAALQEGIEITNNTLDKDFGTFPEHMQLINTRIEGENLILRFRELLGENSLRKLRVNNYKITPVNLNNKIIGEGTIHEHEFPVNAYGIYSFVLSESE
jgi:hypothetical protein